MRLGGIFLGVVLLLAASLRGNQEATNPFSSAKPTLAEEHGELVLTAADLVPGNEALVPAGQKLSAAESPTVTTNQPPTNGVAEKWDPAEILSPGLQSQSNMPPERRQFQEALDELRRQIETVAARNAQTIATGFSLIEPILLRHQNEGMEAVRKMNQTTRLAAGGLIAVMLVGIFAVVYIQMRSMNRIVEVFDAARHPGVAFGLRNAATALASSQLPEAASGAVEQATTRFLGAIDRLEHRILELERIAQHPPTEPEKKAPAPKVLAAPGQLADRPEVVRLSPAKAPRPVSAPGVATSHFSVLLGKGETLLYLGQAEQALQCFEEVLAANPNNSEAWINKGLALEQMQRLEAALESFNQALALDSSLTAAYLYKGGVCNQLQRHSEALECYEKALQAERITKAG